MFENYYIVKLWDNNYNTNKLTYMLDWNGS